MILDSKLFKEVLRYNLLTRNDFRYREFKQFKGFKLDEIDELIESLEDYDIKGSFGELMDFYITDLTASKANKRALKLLKAVRFNQYAMFFSVSDYFDSFKEEDWRDNRATILSKLYEIREEKRILEAIKEIEEYENSRVEESKEEEVQVVEEIKDEIVEEEKQENINIPLSGFDVSFNKIKELVDNKIIDMSTLKELGLSDATARRRLKDLNFTGEELIKIMIQNNINIKDLIEIK